MKATQTVWALPLVLGWIACAGSSADEPNDGPANPNSSSSGETPPPASGSSSSSGDASGSSSSGSSSGGSSGQASSSSSGSSSGGSSGGSSSGGSSSGGSSSSSGDLPPSEIPAECLGELVIDSRPGATRSDVFEQCRHTLDRPVAPMPDETYAQCRVGGPFPLPTYYKYVEIKNPTDRAATVELRVDAADVDVWQYVYLAAYRQLPSSEAERNDCMTGVNGQCEDPIGLSDPRWPCLIGTAAVNVPAQGSVWAYIPQHNPPSQASGSSPVRFSLIASVPQL